MQIYVKNVVVRSLTDTYKTPKILYVTSRAVNIIRIVYYIHGPWRVKNAAVLYCVNYGPFTLL